MSTYTLIILVQSILIFVWVVIVKMKGSKTPEFNNWLINKLQRNPSVHLEEAFNEYISEYNILTKKELPEKAVATKALVKLKLIEQYNIDDVMGEDERYLNYKKTLRSSA